MNDIKTKLAEIDLFLDNEIKSLSRLKRMTTFVGLCLVLFVFGYLFYLTNVLNKNLNDRSIANILSFEFAKHGTITPELESAMTRGAELKMAELKVSAPKFLKDLRAALNPTLKKSIEEIFANADKALQSEIADKASPFRVMLREELEKISDKSIAEKELPEKVNAVLEKAIFKETDKYLKFSLEGIAGIENQITDVLAKKELNENEKLIKQFIIYWVNFFELNFKLNHRPETGTQKHP